MGENKKNVISDARCTPCHVSLRGETRAAECLCVVMLSYAECAERDKLRNEVIRERCGKKDDVVTKIENSMLRWFGHV